MFGALGLVQKNRYERYKTAILLTEGNDMSSNIFHERSIEFQLKIDPGLITKKSDAQKINAELYIKVQEVIAAAVRKLAGKSRLKLTFPEPWKREGIRYDTDLDKAKGLFRNHNMSLAIEATDELTKYKCKLHNFIPELLYAKPETALCYPKDKGRDTKFKLEQDIHLDNCKYCASGSLFLKGRRTDITRVGDFSRLFPGIKSIASASTALIAVSHWQETVCGKMVTAWRDITIQWDLVTRWDHLTGKMIESELSYKVTKRMKDDWDRDFLELASKLYLDLRIAGIFRQSPPIFYFQDPVAGVEIADIAKGR